MNGDKAQINKMQLWSDLMKLGQIAHQTALASEWFHRQSSCDIAQGPVSFGGSGYQKERPCLETHCFRLHGFRPGSPAKDEKAQPPTSDLPPNSGAPSDSGDDGRLTS